MLIYVYVLDKKFMDTCDLIWDLKIQIMSCIELKKKIPPLNSSISYSEYLPPTSLSFASTAASLLVLGASSLHPRHC
jgi:hypothetical protein